MRLDTTNLPAFADGIVGSVLDALSVERTHVVASSFGGYLALRSAAAQPNRVKRMVQLGCPAFVPGVKIPLFMRIATLGAVRGLMERLTPTPSMARRVMQQIGHRASIKAGLIPDPYFDWYASLQRFTDTMQNDGAMVGRIMSIFGESASLKLAKEVLGAVVAPTLFIWGEDDPFGSPNVAEHLASEVPNGKLVLLPRAGHLPWLDAPEVVANATAEFLRTSVGESEQTTNVVSA
jgi:pimeloyl-ACP methyl ester carboxylesterase